MREIAHIHFTALIFLDLGGNAIESIEGLPQVQMPHICRLYLCTHVNNIDDNKITSVGGMRKADWPALQQLEISKRMNNTGENNFGDANRLALGCFWELKRLQVYYTWEDKNTFTEQCFPVKMQATSL